MTTLPDDNKTANERVMSRTIRHSVYLQRYASGASRDVIAFLDEFVFPDLLGKLESRLAKIQSRGLDRGPWTTKRYGQMLWDLWDVLKDGTREANKRVRADLVELSKVEASHVVASVSQSLPADLDVSFRGLDLRSVQTVVSRPIVGAPMRDWWNGIAEQTQRRIESQIGVGMAQGETAEQIIRRIRGTQAAGYSDGALNATRSQAAAIVKTAVNQVSTQTRQQTFKENGDIVKGYRWLSTLDNLTTPICRSRDGKVYPVDSNDLPPAHWNCRSTITPVLKSFREMGIDKDDLKPSTRASMNGQVPATQTYEQWIKEQPKEFQDDALGAARAQAWRSGRITWAEVNAVNQLGRPVPLEDLLDD